MNFDNCFRLGDDPPDWWRDRIKAGGAKMFDDKARVIQGQNIQWVRNGDLIALQPDGFIEVIAVAKVSL